MTTPPVRQDRLAATNAAWRQNLTRLLGTTTPLTGLSATSLERAVHHFRLSPDRDAWIVATLCGAELERRIAGGLTDADLVKIAQTPAPQKRAYHRGDDLLSEVDHITGTPEQVAGRLGVTTAAIAKAAYRHGRREVASVYATAYSRQQYENARTAA